FLRAYSGARWSRRRGWRTACTGFVALVSSWMVSFSSREDSMACQPNSNRRRLLRRRGIFFSLIIVTFFRRFTRGRGGGLFVAGHEPSALQKYQLLNPFVGKLMNKVIPPPPVRRVPHAKDLKLPFKILEIVGEPLFNLND